MADEAEATEARLTAEILERVRAVARLREVGGRAFEPGKSPVRHAVRVYGEAELTNIVEASQQFWLTAGR